MLSLYFIALTLGHFYLFNANPITDCLTKLNSETLCYSSGCQNFCNEKSGQSCENYCASVSTGRSLFIIDECVNLPSAGISPKSVCKCKDVSGSSYGPKGVMSAAACNALYGHQLMRGVLKTIFRPFK